MITTSKAACTPLNLIWKDICTLGWRRDVDEAAEHQVVVGVDELVFIQREADNADALELSMNEENSITERLLGATYSAEKKDAAAGRALDIAVDIAGSRLFFGGVLGAITGWAIAGGIIGAPDIWQIVFQDISSIQCYISDMVLMRQQQNDFREHLRIIALLRSRSYTITTCFHALVKQEQDRSSSSTSLRNLQNLDVTSLANEELARLSSSSSSPGVATASKIQIEKTSFTAHHHLFYGIEKDAKELDALGHATTLVPENVFDQIIVFVTDVMGSMWMLFVFIVGIATWIGLGAL
jgi:low-affinity ferrous iron transport protein